MDPHSCFFFSNDISIISITDGRTFVTIIRATGVPASVHTVSDHHGPSGPLLRPYPDWSWYNSGNCDGITSVYRVAVSILAIVSSNHLIFFFNYILSLIDHLFDATDRQVQSHVGTGHRCN